MSRATACHSHGGSEVVALLQLDATLRWGWKEPLLALAFRQAHLPRLRFLQPGTVCSWAEAALAGWEVRAAFDALQSPGVSLPVPDVAMLCPAAFTAPALVNASCRFCFNSRAAGPHQLEQVATSTAVGGGSHAALLTLPRHLNSLLVRMPWLAALLHLPVE